MTERTPTTSPRNAESGVVLQLIGPAAHRHRQVRSTNRLPFQKTNKLTNLQIGDAAGAAERAHDAGEGRQSHRRQRRHQGDRLGLHVRALATPRRTVVLPIGSLSASWFACSQGLRRIVRHRACGAFYPAHRPLHRFASFHSAWQLRQRAGFLAGRWCGRPPSSFE